MGRRFATRAFGHGSRLRTLQSFKIGRRLRSYIDITSVSLSGKSSAAGGIAARRCILGVGSRAVTVTVSCRYFEATALSVMSTRGETKMAKHVLQEREISMLLD